MATARVITSPEDLKQYDRWIKNHPHGNLWQSLEWKTHQEKLGRETRIYIVEDSSTPSPSSFAKASEDRLPSPSAFAKATADAQGGGKMIVASALVIIDRTTFGLSTWDIPRGPLSDFRLMQMIMRDAKKNKCISLYLSPPVPLLTTHYSLQTSKRHEQPEATRIIDLTKAQPEILAQMKPKGRYNIRIAEKHGVEVNESKDIDAFYELLKGTSDRDGFKPLSKLHYQAFLECLPGSFLLLAYTPQPPPLHPPPQGGVPHVPVAGLMGVCCGKTGIYYYGASDYAYRVTMAPYLLQWEAMKRCKEKGCTTYDLLGIVPPLPLSLTLSPTSAKDSAGRRGEMENDHPWAGVSAFKEKFGGRVIEYPHEREVVLKPLLKKLFAMKRRLL